MLVALWLTRVRAARRVPLLELDGERDRRLHGDHRGTRAPLRRDPPLYPEDRDERRRATRAGGVLRRGAGSRTPACSPSTSATTDPAVVERFTVDLMTWPPRRHRGQPRGARRCFVRQRSRPLRFGIRAPAAAKRAVPKSRWPAARSARVRARARRYLVGDGFTVADLDRGGAALSSWCWPAGADPRLPASPARLASASAAPPQAARVSWVDADVPPSIASACCRSQRRSRPFSPPPLPPPPPPGRRRGAPPRRSPNGRDAPPRPRARGSAPRSR